MLNANLLKAAIVREGLTQGEFAKKIGISFNSLTSRMNGRVPFNVDEIDKACDVLHLDSHEEICNIFLNSSSQK